MFGKGPRASLPKEITIGLDFGTSTTKCIINIEGEGNKDEYFAVKFPSKPEATFFYPTAISYKDGKLYFGDLAAQCSEDDTIYSCKMAIPCIDTWHDFSSPFMWKEEPGSFMFRGDSIYGFSAEELSILYLSNVIRIIRTLVQNTFPNYKPRYSLNMACPLDQLAKDYFESLHQTDKRAGNEENRTRDNYIEHSYKAISQYSLLLSLYSKNPWEIKDACRYINAVKKKPLKDIEQSRALVIPETLAAISSFIRRPGVESGRYFTIDVGAGTTDISVFWLQKNRFMEMPHYYSSGSLHVGVDQFDSALRDISDSYQGHSLRDRRENLTQEMGGLHAYMDKVNHYLIDMLKHRDKCFGRAYYKETKQSIWGDRTRADITMVFCGGGSKLDIIRNTFSNSDIWENVLGNATYICPELEKCKNALTLDHGIVNINRDGGAEDNLNLLLIAEGLASKMIDIPEYGIETKRVHIPKRVEFEYPDY